LLERAGNLENSGSITSLYTVLVEGDDFNEPIADAARSILDGHITLARSLAASNHYPAIDVLESISRLMIDIVNDKHRKMSNDVLNIVSTYRKAEDLINIGAYVEGSNAEIDNAIRMIGKVNSFSRQDIDEKISFEKSKEQLFALFD
jgi:flagellum-specific ATP synthase